LELLGFSAAALTAMGGSKAAVTAALRYLLLGLLGSLAYLLGVALLYIGYGSLDLAALARLVQPDLTGMLALALMTTGLLLKTALFPLHFWLPPAHANAPAPISALLSALVVKGGFYLVLRLWLDLFDNIVSPPVAQILGVLGALAVLWGSWRAFTSDRLKLLAAYSTVAQLGYLFLGLALLISARDQAVRDLLFGGLLLLALTHGFAKAGLFLAIGIVQQRMGHDRIADLDGTARQLPVTTFAFALAGVALIGLPPSGAFLGKWHLLGGAFALQQWFWIPVVLVGSVLAAAYVFRVLGHAFATGPHPGSAVSKTWEEWPAVSLALVAAVLLGLFGNTVWMLVEGVA
jgi:formate hydrogenlyase subunit 3/multisubunit Na+/H+ antiporter MnhD subunit